MDRDKRKPERFYIDSNNHVCSDNESLSKFCEFFNSTCRSDCSFAELLCLISDLVAKNEIDDFEYGSDAYSIEITKDGINISHDYVDEKFTCSRDEMHKALLYWHEFLRERFRNEIRREIKDKATSKGFIYGAIIGFILAFAGASAVLFY